MRRLKYPAAVCLLGAVGVTANPYPMFMTALVLALLGLALGLAGLFWEKADRRGRRALTALLVLAAMGVMGLGMAMGFIHAGGKTDWTAAEESEYAVVLGAGVREDGQPSRILRQRLRAAMEFMDRNPGAKVILSGSKGPGEPVAEADCMYKALLDMGADPEKLIREDRSGTTRENFQNTWAIIEDRGGTEKPLAVITSEFHLPRARYIAGTLGLETCPVAARTDQWYFRWNYTLREVFAFVKARLDAN